MKIITTITTVYDTQTKQITEYRETARQDVPDPLEALGPLTKILPFTEKAHTKCAKCDVALVMRIMDYSPGEHYCYVCGMDKVGGRA